jgi:phosphoribosyl 1,2-cyclic phosphodiesterase
VSALASGSSGNSYLVEAAGIKLLFDAGLNAYTIESYLRGLGASCSELAAIFVTHEHIDHLRGAGMLARRHRLPIVATQGTFNAGAHQFGVLREKVVQPPGTEIDVGGVTVRSFAISHDAVEPCGFWIEAGGWNIVLCTDLGCATDSILEPLSAADLLVLEANHDLDRLWRGRYPYALKRRVAGPHGHLSNADAARLVFDLATGSTSHPRPRTVWLAHLSAANNTPGMALGAVDDPLRREGCANFHVAVLARDRPSHVWSREYAPVAASAIGMATGE